MNYPLEYLKKKKFGQLSFVSVAKSLKGASQCIWKCDCGKEFTCNKFDVIYGKRKSCGCSQYKINKHHKSWKGYEEISGSYWNTIRVSAKKRKLKMSVSIKDVWQLFIKQNRMCALTGVPIIFQSKCEVWDGTASLDRIDSTRGYTLDNIQWVHKVVNMMKQQVTQQEFIEWCQKIVDHACQIKK